MRHQPLFCPLVCVLVLLATAAARAQGVLPLSGTYRAGSVGTYFDGPCGLATGLGIVGDDGTMTFQPNGTFAFSFSVHDVCAGGNVQPGAENGNGSYTVDRAARLQIDFEPQNPGEETETAFLRADGSVAIASRDKSEDETSLWILVRLSSGQSNASLNGEYHVGRLVLRNDATGMSTRTELGTITFDGAGSYTETGQRHAVSIGGSGVSSSYNVNGSYGVAADGTLNTGPGTNGAVSSDGEIFFWTRRAGVEVELTVGVRRGSGLGAGRIGGEWRIAVQENHIGALAQLSPELETSIGVLEFIPHTNAGGALDGSLLVVKTEQSGTTVKNEYFSDTYTLTGTGSLVLAAGGNPGVPGALGAQGTFLIGSPRPSEGAGLLLGLYTCPWPRVIGIGTAGSGGIPPLVTPTGGFPILGNAGYGLSITSGLGGAPAAMLFAASASSGVPLFGGLFWLAPPILLSVPLGLSGPIGTPGAGAAGIPLGIPALSSLEGVSFVVQGFVVDAGAPQLLAMTPGVEVTICR